VTYIGAISTVVGPPESWPIVELAGERWHVAPRYIAPVARGDVLALADAWECDVPSRELVDAIWRAADVRLDPYSLTRPPTLAEASSWAAYADQAARIERALAGREGLVVGTHKDFASLGGGRIDLYGWHTLAGRPIEPGRTSHSATYVDYSQGLRLVRRVGDARAARRETWEPPSPRAIAAP